MSTVSYFYLKPSDSGRVSKNQESFITVSQVAQNLTGVSIWIVSFKDILRVRINFYIFFFRSQAGHLGQDVPINVEMVTEFDDGNAMMMAESIAIIHCEYVRN